MASFLHLHSRFFLACIISFLPISSSALPLGNPGDASFLCNGVFTGQARKDCGCGLFSGLMYKFRVGYYGDFVFDRRLETHESGHSKNIRQTEIRTNAGYLAFTLNNLAEAFATFGASRINLTALQSVWGPAANNFTYLLSDTRFSWSAGGRATIWQWRCLGFGAEGQYFATSPTLATFRIEGGIPEYLDFKLKFREWQAGIGAFYRIRVASRLSAIIPYAGVKWSGASLKTGNAKSLNGADTFFDMRNQRNFGYAVGMTFVGNAKWSVSGEARFVDERAFNFLTQFVF